MRATDVLVIGAGIGGLAATIAMQRAGVRVRVGDDVYESSVAGQLEQLARSV